MMIRCEATGKANRHAHETVAEVRQHWTEVRTGTVATPAPVATSVTKLDTRPATEGMYRKDGVIYKVVLAVHGSGRPYAKRFEMSTDADGKAKGIFLQAKGMVSKLTQEDRMSKEEAAAFGHLYGVCVRCGATLTDEDSIARGIGPVCAGKI